MSKLKTFTELNLVRRNIIMLENNLLEFDITGILGSEINQHIDFYNDGVNEAYIAIDLVKHFCNTSV